MKKILSLTLSVLILLSVLPMTVNAAISDGWETMTFDQDGPSFSIKVTGFEAADVNETYSFTAIAYKGNDELVDTKTAEVSIEDGELTADVNFEEGGSEADPLINKVVVKLINSGGEVLGDGKAKATFDIIPQEVDANGVYNNLTNGFYKQANVSGNAPLGSNYNIVWKDANAIYFARNTESTNKHDSNPSTMSDNTSAINAQYARMQYLTFFSTNKFQIDRLVAYLPAATDGSFYLIDNDKVNYAAGGYAAKFNKDATNTDGIKFVGSRGTESCVSNTQSTINGIPVDRLVFNTDYYCRAMVFDANPENGYYYAVNEFLPYVKVKNSIPIASNMPAVASFVQDGATFSVTATGLEAISCTLTAIARDESGERILQKVATGSVNAGVFRSSVDFEKAGQPAPDNITSVTLTLTDENGKLLANEKTFEITKESGSPLNGFYKKIDSVSYRDVYYYSTDGTTIGNSTPGGENNNELADGDLNTNIGMTSPVPDGRLYMFGSELSEAIDIDMVVLDYKQGTSDVYLSKDAPDNTNLGDFAGKQTKSGIYYAGKLSNRTATVKQAVLPVKAKSGETYQYIIMSASGGEQPGEFHELQLYTGVKDEEKLEILADGPVAGSAAVFTDGIEVARNAAAFSYGSQAGTDASFAVDGDVNTAWISANESAYRDYLILDLGASYIIDGLKLTMAEGSDQNFTVYGMNTLLNSERNNSISQDVSATEFRRTALTEMLSDISEGEEITDIKSFDRFRYLVFEQEAAPGTAFGFAEIGVYTLDAAEPDNKPVSKAKSELAVFSKDVSGAADTKFEEAKTNVPDSDPSTTTNVGFFNAGHNGQVVQTVMLDLKQAQKVSHIAYQSASKEHHTEYTYFVLVGANSLPSAGAYVTRDSGNTEVTSLQNVDVLARFDGASDVTVSLGGNSDETGLLIFEVPEEHRDKSYRYIGLMKYDTEEAQVKGGGLELKTRVGTLHAYTQCDDVADLVAESGQNYILDAGTEKVTITNNEISYSAGLWNGNTGGNLIGILTHYDANGVQVGKSEYVDCGILIPGAYNNIGFTHSVTNGETGTWELTLLCGNKIYDHIYDLCADKLQRKELYIGEGIEKGISFNRAGTTALSSGTVDAGMVGMIILKPDSNPERFSSDDVYDHIFAEVPEGSKGAWNYSLRYTVPADAPGNVGDEYIACLLSCNDSLTGEAPLAIPVFNESLIESDFESAAINNIANLITTTYVDFFGSELATDVAAITGTAAKKENFGKEFKLAQVGFEENIFEEGLNTIDTISAAVQAALVIDATINNTDVKETIAAFGGAMPMVFDTPYYDEDDFAEILPGVLPSLVTSLDATKANAENLATAYKRTIALSLIADGGVAEREAAITNYSKELGIQDTTLNTKQEMGAIAQKLSSDMSVVKNKYAGGMDNIVKNIIIELDQQANNDDALELGNKGNTGGGGISIGSASKADDLQTGQNNNAHSNTESTIQQATGFTDISRHVWAHDAILRMKDNGIINGVSETSFAPDASLTREQAAKFVVLTMQLPTSLEDNGFLDCDYNSWYYPFVSSAVEHGIVNGVSALEFGVGQNITRQDLAVIIYRGLKNLKLIDKLEQKSFTDDGAISSYAKDAVGILGNIGIITGFEDGSFGPKENATRAQAAVIFTRFLDYIESANVGEEG